MAASAARCATTHGLVVLAGWVWLAGCGGGDGKPDANQARRSPVAHLEAMKGAVTLDREGKQSPAQLGYLYPNDAIETGADGSARVRLSGGRVVEIGPDARFELREGEGGVLLELARGLLLTRVEGGGAMGDSKVSLTILTPFGLTRVGSGGSELSVDVGKDGAAVDVKLGAVELVSRNGEVTKANQGDKLSLGGAVAKPGDLVLPPIEVVIIQATGKAELKKKDEKKWAAVSGKKPTPIADGDSVRVKGGQLVLQPKDAATRLALNSGAAATLTGASKGPAGEELLLELSSGQAEATMAPAQRTRLGFGGLAVVAPRGGKAVVDKTAKGFTVRSLVGALKLEREGKEAVEVPGGSVATLEGDKVSVVAPGKESMTLPSRNGLKVFQPQPSPIAITWDGEDGKDYRVEVASDAAFKNVQLSGEVRAHHLNVNSPARGGLYWRVFDGENEVGRGGAQFAPEPKGPDDLGRNKNEVPEGTEKTTIYYQDKPPVVTFSWKTEPGAAKYKVRVYREGSLSKTVAEKDSAAPPAALAEGALSEGNYLWSVTPLGNKGEELRGGKMNKLEIVYDNAVQGLVIKSPKNGDPGGKEVSVTGIAPIGAKVSVNGRPLTVDSANRFSGTATPLLRGLLVFRMQLGAAEVYTVRRLKGR